MAYSTLLSSSLINAVYNDRYCINSILIFKFPLITLACVHAVSNMNHTSIAKIHLSFPHINSPLPTNYFQVEHRNRQDKQVMMSCLSHEVMTYLSLRLKKKVSITAITKQAVLGCQVTLLPAWLSSQTFSLNYSREHQKLTPPIIF